MRFTFIQAHARIFHIATMCRVLEVSKAGYHAWRARPLRDRVKDDIVLTARIREIQKEVRGRYGSPRTHQELKALGFTRGEHKVARPMKRGGIRAKSARKFRVTTKSETHRKARGGLHHSDRGVQDASAAYQLLLKQAGFQVSMSRVGDCWDNAVVESVFATVTKELLVDGPFETRTQASREIFEFIEIWYNRRRRHSSLGYRTPAEYEAVLAKAS
jgi:transposase InsO family protein